MSTETHTFEIGDPVCIVGTWRPPATPSVGTVTKLTPTETYDIWARFGEHDHPFRTDELAPAADGGLVTGLWGNATTVNTEPVPTVTVGRRWSNPSHLTIALGLGLVLGVITGVLAAPVETVEVRTTVTHAAPPVCLHAARSGRVEMDLRETRDAHDDAVIAAAAEAFEAQVYGNVDEMVAKQEMANAEKLLRDAAENAREDAEVSFRNHAAACETWTVPQRTTERVAS